MLLRLKNASTTHHRAMTTIFHDILHDPLEDYVDVKSKKVYSHVNDLKEVFITCSQYKLGMNHLKCSFIFWKILRILCL